MSELKHAPRPWRVGPNPYNDREALIPIVDKDGEPVLTVLSPHKSASISVSDADLRLMVAAPDLLEALKEIAQASTWTMHPECMEPIGRLTDIAHTAIAGGETGGADGGGEQ